MSGGVEGRTAERARRASGLDESCGLDREGSGLLPCDRDAGDGAHLTLDHELLDDQDDPVLDFVEGDTDGPDGPCRLGGLLELLIVR